MKVSGEVLLGVAVTTVAVPVMVAVHGTAVTLVINVTVEGKVNDRALN